MSQEPMGTHDQAATSEPTPVPVVHELEVKPAAGLVLGGIITSIVGAFFWFVGALNPNYDSWTGASSVSGAATFGSFVTLVGSALLLVGFYRLVKNVDTMATSYAQQNT